MQLGAHRACPVRRPRSTFPGGQVEAQTLPPSDEPQGLVDNRGPHAAPQGQQMAWAPHPYTSLACTLPPGCPFQTTRPPHGPAPVQKADAVRVCRCGDVQVWGCPGVGCAGVRMWDVQVGTCGCGMCGCGGVQVQREVSVSRSCVPWSRGKRAGSPRGVGSRSGLSVRFNDFSPQRLSFLKNRYDFCHEEKS